MKGVAVYGHVCSPDDLFVNDVIGLVRRGAMVS